MVLSDDMDGKQLREAKVKNPFHLRCDGKSDDVEINEAFQDSKQKRWCGLGEAFDRIFGGK